MSEQPEALRLADALENTPNWQKEEWNSDWKASVMHFSRVPFEAAAELRRLHGEVESYGTIIQYHEASIARLTANNQELLEALKSMMRYVDEDCGDSNCDECKHYRPIWAAIAKAEGETK